jgi:energy-coupling factor transporter transmembrane protein EcfT
LKATVYKSIEYEESIEDFNLLGVHEKIYWWVLWRILGVLGFTIIFGLLTELIWIFKSGLGKEKWFKSCKDASFFFWKLENSYQDSICVQGDFNQRNLEFKDAINLFLLEANNFLLEHNFYSWNKGVASKVK